jgi:hypothetical protein
MATYGVSGDQHREVDLLIDEIKRQLHEPSGSPVDPDVVVRKLQLIVASAPATAATGSATPERAAVIMGSAFHGVDALRRHFGVRLSANEAALLATVPFSQQLLAQSRDTHILVAGARVSIMDIRAVVPDAFYFKKAWYAEESFARRKVKTAWHLIRREPVAGSTSKAWAEQQAVFSDDEDTPRMCEMVLAVILHYLDTGERLFPAVYVRTRDFASDRRQAGLGRFGAGGLRIRSWGDYPDYYIGVAGAAKSSRNRRAARFHTT